MGFHGWSSEYKITITPDHVFVDLLPYLGPDCGPGVYGCKNKILQVKQGGKPVWRLLIKKLGQADHPHLIIDFKPLDRDNPVEAWHYTERDKGFRIGSVDEFAIRTLMTVLLKKIFN